MSEPIFELTYPNECSKRLWLAPG